jgi:acetoin utilization protein AcuB
MVILPFAKPGPSTPGGDNEMTMTADDIMTRDPVTVSENASLGEALEILSELEIRHLPVVRKGEVVGMLSDRDVRALGMSVISDVRSMDSFRSSLTARVTSLMTGDVLTVDRDTTLPEITELMITEKVGAIPVVEANNNNLVGIISYIDVLKAVREQME